MPLFVLFLILMNVAPGTIWAHQAIRSFGRTLPSTTHVPQVTPAKHTVDVVGARTGNATSGNALGDAVGNAVNDTSPNRYRPSVEPQVVSPEIVTSNMNQIPGYEIIDTVGIGSAHSIQARHLGKDLLSAFRAAVGGNLSHYNELVNSTATDVMTKLKAQAAEQGANGIARVRFRPSFVDNGISEIFAYGTFVKVRKLPPKEPTILAQGSQGFPQMNSQFSSSLNNMPRNLPNTFPENPYIRQASNPLPQRAY